MSKTDPGAAPDPRAAFWSMAFAGPTPIPALALALRERLVPRDGLATHGPAWLEAWLAGVANRFNDRPNNDCAPQHKPWQRGSVHVQALAPAVSPRLADLVPGTKSEEAGLLEILQGFADAGVDLTLPFSGAQATDAFEALVAMNLPAAIDWWATQPRRPDPAALSARATPQPVLGERTPLPWLHAAALGWHETLLEALLDYGLDPDTPDARGRTPLFHARTPRQVKALLAAGADPDRTDAMGRTAADYWHQQDKGDFPGPARTDPVTAMIECLGSSARTPQALSTATVMHAAKHEYERREDWERDLPNTGQPLHAARINPGGAWKGEWSPAAWVGLQVLQGNPIGSYKPQSLVWMLERPDFLSPTDYSPRGRLTEHGIWGVALAACLATLARLSTAAGDVGRRLERIVVDRWGPRWFWEDPWAGPICQTTRALLDAKGTSKQVREGIERAWMNQFNRGAAGFSPRTMALALWDAKAGAGLRFEDQGWEPLFNNLHDPLRATLGLLRANDLIEVQLRTYPARHPDMASGAALSRALDDYQVIHAWRNAADYILDLPGDLERPDDRLDQALEESIARMSKMDEKAEAIAHLRAGRLDKALPMQAPSRRSPRF